MNENVNAREHDYDDVKETFRDMLIRLKDIVPILFFIITSNIGVCIVEKVKDPSVFNTLTDTPTYVHLDCFQMVRLTVFISILLLGFNMAVIAIDLNNRPLGKSLIYFDLFYNIGNILGYVAIIFFANKFTANCPMGDCSTYKTVATVISAIMILVYAVNIFLMVKRDKEINDDNAEYINIMKNSKAR